MATKGTGHMTGEGFRIANYSASITAFDTYAEAQIAADETPREMGADWFGWVEAAPSQAPGKFVVKYRRIGATEVFYC